MKTTPISSLDLTCPTSWKEVSDEQLRDIAEFSVLGRDVDYVKTLLLMKWNGLQVVSGRGFRAEKGLHWLRKGKLICRVSSKQLASAVSVLDFLEQVPEIPIRLEQINGCSAVRADLRDTLFGEYLQIENLYQGFLVSNNPEALDRAAAILYPGLEKKLTEAERFIILLWLAGLKNLFARQFDELYRPVADTQPDEASSQHDIMLTQLRALTGGDVTKMQQVRETATWDALDELNEKAREARELKKMMKRK